MAVFRVERNKGYTVMSNHHLRNKELSLKAKGLLSQMLSLPEDWDYTLKGLSLINREKMAMNRIERIDKEIAKTREKITEYQNRLRGLEAQKTEAENLQIVQLVRSMRLSPHELSAMLSGGGIPGMEAAPGYPAEPADHDTEEMEDTENE